MSPFIVYSITCRFTGMTYIGRTKNEARRRTEHMGALSRGTHINARLQRAFNKYGAAQFRWSVIGRYNSEQEARASEQWFLDSLWTAHCLLNLSRSSTGGSKPNCHSAEVRARMSETRRAYLSDPAVRANLSAKHKGKTLSPEHRAKLSAAHRGKVLTPEHRAAMSSAQKTAWVSRKLEQPA